VKHKFQIGDMVKTYRVKGTAKFIGIIIAIDEGTTFPYRVCWVDNLSANKNWFHEEHLIKVC
jgi:hypothetical protein